MEHTPICSPLDISFPGESREQGSFGGPLFLPHPSRPDPFYHAQDLKADQGMQGHQISQHCYMLGIKDQNDCKEELWVGLHITLEVKEFGDLSHLREYPEHLV